MNDAFEWVRVMKSPTPRVRRGVGRHTDLFTPTPCTGVEEVVFA
jgi:hypothetical protein